MITKYKVALISMLIALVLVGCNEEAKENTVIIHKDNSTLIALLNNEINAGIKAKREGLRDSYSSILIQTDSVLFYIDEFRTNLINKSVHGKNSVEDIINSSYNEDGTLNSKASQILVGEDPSKPISQEFSGLELQKVLHGYFESLQRQNLLSELQCKMFTKNCVFVYPSDGAKEPWASAYFFNNSIGMILTKLSYLETELFLVEQIAITTADSLLKAK